MTSNQTSFVPTYPDGTPVHGFLNPETSPFFMGPDDANHGNPEDDTPDQALCNPEDDILNPETSPFFMRPDDASQGDPEDDTPDQALARAASDDNIDAMRDLLQQGVEIDSRTRMCACSPAVWQLLLDHGVEINPYPSDHTPLLYVSSIFVNSS